MKINIEYLNIKLASRCLTKAELSSISGVNKTTLSRIFKGKQDPQPVTVGKIAKGLNTTVEELTKDISKVENNKGA